MAYHTDLLIFSDSGVSIYHNLTSLKLPTVVMPLIETSEIQAINQPETSKTIKRLERDQRKTRERLERDKKENKRVAQNNQNWQLSRKLKCQQLFSIAQTNERWLRGIQREIEEVRESQRDLERRYRAIQTA